MHILKGYKYSRRIIKITEHDCVMQFRYNHWFFGWLYGWMNYIGTVSEEYAQKLIKELTDQDTEKDKRPKVLDIK